MFSDGNNLARIGRHSSNDHETADGTDQNRHGNSQSHQSLVSYVAKSMFKKYQKVMSKGSYLHILSSISIHVCQESRA